MPNFIRTKNKINKIKQRTLKRKGQFTRKNCSPIVDGQTVNKNSCFTRNVMFNLKQQYNNKFPDETINKNTPSEIWEALKSKMNMCRNEECWLSELAEPQVKARLEKYAFSPKSPRSWNNDPNEWLTNHDINNVLTQYEYKFDTFEFIGPSFIDFNTKTNNGCVDNEVCMLNIQEQIDNKKDKIGIIFNLDRHNQSGSHWVSLFIDIKDKFIFYFDSVGTKIPSQIYKLVQNIQEQGKRLEIPIHFRFEQNHPFEHQETNTECGMYSLFFIITLLTNKVYKKPFKNVDEKIKFFKTKKIPDKKMEELRKIYYN